MADNIMNDNAKDNNADNNVIEFDSKVTEKDLLRFKFYHKYHTISGMAEIMLALIMIVLCVISIGRVNASYSLMVGVFGVFFLVFPSVDMKHRAKRQMEKVVTFKEQVHYRIDNKGITVSLNDVTETLGWDKIYRIKFDGANIDVYMTTVNANIIPVRDFNGRADEFIRMAQQHLKPFQIKVDVKKMNKVA